MTIDSKTDASPTERVAQALTEFGGAIRGDWGSIDGRSVRAQLDLLADYLRYPESTPPLPDIRIRLDVCPYGKGHWTEYCEDYCLGEDTLKESR